MFYTCMCIYIYTHTYIHTYVWQCMEYVIRIQEGFLKDSQEGPQLRSQTWLRKSLRIERLGRSVSACGLGSSSLGSVGPKRPHKHRDPTRQYSRYPPPSGR